MLTLSPEILKQAYEFLCSTEPFARWNMPDSDDVKFKVSRDRATRGYCITLPRKKFLIAISAWNIGHTINLIGTMAHEMIHVYQGVTNMETKGAEHNAAFLKLAAQVCKVHGFDPKLF